MVMKFLSLSPNLLGEETGFFKVIRSMSGDKRAEARMIWCVGLEFLSQHNTYFLVITSPLFYTFWYLLDILKAILGGEQRQFLNAVLQVEAVEPIRTRLSFQTTETAIAEISCVLQGPAMKRISLVEVPIAACVYALVRRHSQNHDLFLENIRINNFEHFNVSSV